MSSRYTIAFYNTENLFDIANQKDLLDDDFTATGRRKWTPKRYDNKIMKLASAIAKIGWDETRSLPSLVGLAEIENAKVLTDLIDNEYLGRDTYNFVHFDSIDERGMDVALLYNKHIFTVEQAAPMRAPMIYDGGGRDRTRDILYVKGKLSGALIHLLVVHMPSRREGDINSPKRHAIAESLGEKVRALQEEEDHPLILIMGDFNADPQADSIKNFFHTTSEKDSLDKYGFYNPMENLESKGSFTTTHQKHKLLYDQMLFSAGFFHQNTHIELIEAQVFNPHFLQEWNEKYAGQPFRTYVGSKYLGGYSDHFPVYSIIKI